MWLALLVRNVPRGNVNPFRRGSASGSLPSLGNHLVLFLTPDQTRALPDVYARSFARMDSRAKTYGKVTRTHYGLAPPPLLLTLRGLSLHV